MNIITIKNEQTAKVTPKKPNEEQKAKTRPPLAPNEFFNEGPERIIDRMRERTKDYNHQRNHLKARHLLESNFLS